MKNYWIAVVVAGALVVSAVAQTGASGSAGTQASVSAGQSGADVNASQNTKANAGSENSNAKHQGGNASASAAFSFCKNDTFVPFWPFMRRDARCGVGSSP